MQILFRDIFYSLKEKEEGKKREKKRNKKNKKEKGKEKNFRTIFNFYKTISCLHYTVAVYIGTLHFISIPIYCNVINLKLAKKNCNNEYKPFMNYL